jgi:uncharacterized RDD family membrane protein YckC
LSASPDFARDAVGFGPRLGAFALDALLVFVVAGPLTAMVGRFAAPIFFVLGSIAFTIFCWWRYGATPGKIAFAARIVDARSGGRPSLARLGLRYLAYAVSAAPLFLGFAWIAIDRRKQAWHDKIAGTLVIDEE